MNPIMQTTPSTPASNADAMMFVNETDTAMTEDHAPLENAWKILIVDDDLDIHRVTRLVLSPFVFKGRPIVLLFASSGAEARVVLAENPDIAVVILDVVMETDDAGLLLVRFIREQYFNRKT